MPRKPDLTDRTRYHHIREVRGKYRVVVDVRAEPRQQAQRSFPLSPEGLRRAVEWRDITLGQVASGTYTRQEAISRFKQAESLEAPPVVTFDVLADRFLASKLGEIRPNSIDGYRRALARARRHFRDAPVHEFTAEHVIALRTAMLREPTRTGRVASHRTIVYTLLAVRLVFEFGVRAGYLTSNPAGSVKPPRKSSIKTRTAAPATWTPDEFRRFVGYLGEEPDARDRHDPRHGAWVKPAFLLSACGLRRGEVLGLCWDAVDLEQGTVRVEASRTRTGGHNGETDRDDAKSGNSRRTLHPDDLHPGVMEALRDLRDAQAKDLADSPACYDNPDRLVVVNPLGAGVDPETFRTRFRRLCQGAGVSTIGLHRIRHTLANLMHDHAVPPKRAADLLGHSIEVHLSRYITNTESGTLEAGLAVGQALWPRPG
jgi:integrase